MKKMTSVAQDVVLLVNLPRGPWDTSLKGGNMLLNRFFIDEEMANESSGVFYLPKDSASLFDFAQGKEFFSLNFHGQPFRFLAYMCGRLAIYNSLEKKKTY